MTKVTGTDVLASPASTKVDAAHDSDVKAAERAVRKGHASGKHTPALEPRDLLGPSPNVATNLAIADIALRGGSMLARQAIERTLLGRRYAPKKAKAILKGRSFSEVMLHRMAAKVALRSVPGAIVIGGALLAKTLYDRSRSRDALLEGEKDLAQQASEGSED